VHAKALAYKNKLGAAFEMLKQGWVKNKDNKEIKSLMDELENEIKMDGLMPKDHPERGKMQRYLDWLKGNGSRFSKIKLRLCSETGQDW
jgi:hypothetical protein